MSRSLISDSLLFPEEQAEQQEQAILSQSTSKILRVQILHTIEGTVPVNSFPFKIRDS